MATLIAEHKIERAHVSIMQSKMFRFFSGLTMIGKVTVSDDVATACTNGRDVIYGRKFVDKLPEKQLLFIVIHELSHIAWRHTTTYKHLYDKDAQLANIACDFVINLQIVDQDPHATEVEFPTKEDGTKFGCIDEKYRGMDVTQVFNLLMKEYPPSQPSDGTGEGGQGQSGQNGRGGKSRDDLDGEQFDEHDFEGAEKLTEDEKAELSTRVTQALHQGKQLAGKMGGDVPRGLGELVDPQVPWQEVLRDLVKQVCKGTGDTTWRRFSKRHLGAGIYLPSTISEKVGRILDAIDTSGSIGDSIISVIMTEVKSICDEVRPEGVDLLYWGTDVVGHEFYGETELDSLIDNTRPVGGGGTDPDCIPRYMKKHSMNPEIVIVLTDGYFYDGIGDWSEVSAPIIWCVIDNPSFTSSIGKVIHIKE
jgi:predicted metal-dependent peptidase